MRETCVGNSFLENEVAKATFTCSTPEGEIVAMLGTPVDDLLWTAAPKDEQLIQKILDKFNVRKVEQDSFRFCGKEIKRDKDFSIKISCKDTSER